VVGAIAATEAMDREKEGILGRRDGKRRPREGGAAFKSKLTRIDDRS
jgi:hypothetical protein